MSTTNEKGETVALLERERICNTDSASEQIAGFMADYADQLCEAIDIARAGNATASVYRFACATSSLRYWATNTRADDGIAEMLRDLALNYRNAVSHSHAEAERAERARITGAPSMAELAEAFATEFAREQAVTALYDADAERADAGSADPSEAWQSAVDDAEREYQHAERTTRELADKLAGKLQVTLETCLTGSRNAATETARIAAIDLMEERLADVISNAADFARRVVSD